MQYKSLAMLRRNKVAISEANIKQLNFFGNKFLKYTQQMLQDFFPSNLKLVQDALDSSLVTDATTGQPILECLSENHIFHLYVNLMFRTAQKSELLVLERIQEKLQYLKLSLSYYTELLKLFTMMGTMLRESTNAKPPEFKDQLNSYIESRSEQFR